MRHDECSEALYRHAEDAWRRPAEGHASDVFEIEGPANRDSSAGGVPTQSHPEPQPKSKPEPRSKPDKSDAASVESRAGSGALYTDPKTFNR
jgi:hypothetical protein